MKQKHKTEIRLTQPALGPDRGDDDEGVLPALVAVDGGDLHPQTGLSECPHLTAVEGEDADLSPGQHQSRGGEQSRQH